MRVCTSVCKQYHECHLNVRFGLRQTQGFKLLHTVIGSGGSEVKTLEDHLLCKQSWPMNIPKAHFFHLKMKSRPADFLMPPSPAEPSAPRTGREPGPPPVPEEGRPWAGLGMDLRAVLCGSLLFCLFRRTYEGSPCPALGGQCVRAGGHLLGCG